MWTPALWLINELLNLRWIFMVSDLAAGRGDVNNSEMKLAKWECSNKNNKTLYVFIPEFLHAAAGESARAPPHHINADEILKSRLRWTHRFLSAAAADWRCRRKRKRWTSVSRSEVQKESVTVRSTSDEDTSPWLITVVAWCDVWALSRNRTWERGRKWPKMNIILWSNQHEKLFLCLHKIPNVMKVKCSLPKEGACLFAQSSAVYESVDVSAQKLQQ